MGVASGELCLSHSRCKPKKRGWNGGGFVSREVCLWPHFWVVAVLLIVLVLTVMVQVLLVLGRFVGFCGPPCPICHSTHTTSHGESTHGRVNTQDFWRFFSASISSLTWAAVSQPEMSVNNEADSLGSRLCRCRPLESFLIDWTNWNHQLTLV